MENPFKLIESRLSLIENLILDLKNEPVEVKSISKCNDELLSVQGAAKFLNLTVSTIYSKVSRGELPGVCKRGKRLYFSYSELMNYVKEGRLKSNLDLEKEAESYLSNLKERSNG